jgi:hypothetical protein
MSVLSDSEVTVDTQKLYLRLLRTYLYMTQNKRRQKGMIEHAKEFNAGLWTSASGLHILNCTKMYMKERHHVEHDQETF